MKALILSLLTAGGLALSPSAAMADNGRHHHHHHHGHHHHGYYGNYRLYQPGYNYGYYRPYYRPTYSYPYAYGYPYGYNYNAFPRYGVGHTGPNVSIWYGW